jgi:hypothetical protein
MNNDALDIGCRPIGAGSITSNAPLPSKSKEVTMTVLVDNYTGCVTVSPGRVEPLRIL